MPAKLTKLAIVLLAAGQAKRFGSKKQLAQVNEASAAPQPMLVRALNRLMASSKLHCEQSSIFVALAPDSSELMTLLPPEIQAITCKESHLGLGVTIQNVMVHLENHNVLKPQTQKYSHVLFCLADQVALETHHIDSLISSCLNNPDKLIAAKTRGGISAPAIFPEYSFDELKKLTGDKGAKSVLIKFQPELVLVDLPEAAVDIDTQMDLTQWNSQIIKREQA